MQALGVIAVNYNLFEGSLYPLFAHHLTRAGMTDEECKYAFWNYDNAQRASALSASHSSAARGNSLSETASSTYSATGINARRSATS